jgi:hydrogenase large subunit
MEVGPLARYILGYAHARQGNPHCQRVMEQLDSSLRAVNRDLPKALGVAETELSAKQLLPSTIGRTLTRALEAEYCAEMMRDDWNALMSNIRNGDRATANVDKWDPSTWPAEAKGVGAVAAPRGALGHWIRIRNGKIENYQCVVPSTWNGGPRDPKGQIGAFEAALLNTPVAVADQPVEILRTLHSFDPCMACATHVMSEDGAELSTVKVR